MRSGRNLFALFTLLVFALFTAACDQSDPEAEQAAVSAQEWAEVQEAKTQLDSKRQELAAMKDQLDAEPMAEDAAADPGDDPAGGDPAAGDPAGEGEEAEAAPTADDVTALQNEVDEMTADFSAKLITFINNQGITEGQDFTDIQQQAFNMKAQEDILIAMEFIDKGGEYQRAIDIIGSSLVADPTNTYLLEAKAKAEELRHMTEERFAAVEKGMSTKEVRALLGIPKGTNMREFENGVTGWFYPKEEPNHAAGVFFQNKNDELKVYKTDFDAIKPKTEGE